MFTDIIFLMKYMSVITKIIDSEDHVYFNDINEFIEDLKNGLTYVSNNDFIGPGNDDTIKITLESKGSPKLYCYMNYRKKCSPQIKVTPELFDEIIKGM